jgi:ethanolamine transporter EutH
MANLVWAIAIPFWLIEPSSLPLSVGVLAGLMWVPLSWMIQHWVGLFHAITRTVLVAGAWFTFPSLRFTLIPGVIVIIYLVSIVALVGRRPAGAERPTS